jgi:chitinase
LIVHRHRSGRPARGLAVAMVLTASLAAAVVIAGPVVPTASAAAGPVSRAAPYLTLGWGSPQSPPAIMAATGIHDFTLAFIGAGRGCDPLWDGTRSLLGGTDAASITAIRAAGGDVSVSFGGWSGRKLGSVCRTPAALAAAYGHVVSAYGLRAIDIDIEHGEFTSARTRVRVIAALGILQSAYPNLEITVTFGTDPNGPSPAGASLIADAASIGFQPFAWTVMPFDFGVPVSDMGATSVAAAEGLHATLMAAYGESSSTAYVHMGISTMNGKTDEADETVGSGDFLAMLAYSRNNHLARLTFWMVNRDRPCLPGLVAGNTCSGIAQTAGEFTALDAGFVG